MPFEHWFSGEIKTSEPATGVVRTFDNYQFLVKQFEFKKDTLYISFYYNSDVSLKKVALIFEEEFKATSGLWLLVGKWAGWRRAHDCDIDIEKMKERHRIEEEYELVEIEKLKARHARQAAQRRKELGDFLLDFKIAYHSLG